MSFPDIPNAEINVTSTKLKIPLRCGDYTLPPGQAVRVPISFLAQFGAAEGLVFDFSPVADYLRTHTDDGRPVIDFWCPLSVVDGYGRHALDIHRGLRQLGVETPLHASAFVDLEYINPGLVEEARRGKYLAPAKVAVSMSVPYDPILTDNPSVMKIAITQFETDHVPQRHVERVSRCHHLICTSGFQPSVWRQSGLKIPISVMTPGVDTDYFAYRDRPITNRFRVLILGALTPRKNTDGAIRIFQEASEGNPDWRLTVKSRGYIGDDVRRLAAQDSRIEILFGDAPPNAILDMYHNHDCFLWPSKGEGVGLPPLEALSTGMEVVLSDNSGMMDYASERWSYTIKTAGLIAADGPGECFAESYVREYGNVGNYWMPDHGHAVKQLRKCFSNWLDGKRRGPKAAEYVRAHHTLRHQAESVLKVAETYL